MKADATPNATLRAEGLRVRLGGNTVLAGVDGLFGRGFTSIVGPNGAGKSTLLRVLAGLHAPDAGQVWLNDRPLAAFTPRERGRHIAWLAQQGDSTGELTVRQTVALGRLPHHGLLGAAGPADAQAIDAALAATEATAFQHRRLATLSGGERQRALLARALATQAPVLLFDEPTTHLDPPHQVALARLARQLGRSHTVLAVVHDLALALAADQVLLLDAGRVVAFAPAPDKALHAAITRVFQGAVRIGWHDGRAAVLPTL